MRAREKQLGGMAVRKLSCPDGGVTCWNPQMTHASPGLALRIARENLAQAQRELADLEDLARRNSIPPGSPGWLRER